MKLKLTKWTLKYRILTSILQKISLIIFFYICSQAIAPSKGMDFSDEGHYLLSADSSDPTDGWGWPYGWNLHLLFKVSNYSIESFRTYGLILLLLANYRFSRKLIETLNVGTKHKFSRIEVNSFKVLITSSSALFYAGFLRSPSYNWLNLVGIVVFLTGCIQLIAQLNFQHDLENKIWLYKIEISLGLFLTFPAKPSSIGFGLFSLFVSILIIKNLKYALKISVQIFIVIWLLVLLAILVKAWPSTIWQQASQVLKMPPLSPNHSLAGATLDLLLTPFNLLRNLLMSSGVYIVIAALVFTYIFSKFRKNQSEVPFLTLFFLLLLTSAYKFLDKSVFYGTNEHREFWHANTLISNSIIGLLTVVVFYRYFKNDRSRKKEIESKSVTLFSKVIYFNLLVATISFGFGTSGGILSKLPICASFTTSILALLVFTSIGNESTRKIVSLSLNLYIVFVVFVVFLGSYNNPYRSSGLFEMNYPTVIGNHDSVISLDQKNSKQITKLRKSATAAGFLKNTQVINLVYPSNVGIGYALGGRQSPTIHFVWFGYPNSLIQAKYLFSQSVGRFDFEEAWILKSSEERYEQELPTAINLLRYIQKFTLKEIPKDYFLVYEDSELELWKPILAQSK